MQKIKIAVMDLNDFDNLEMKIFMCDNNSITKYPLKFSTERLIIPVTSDLLFRIQCLHLRVGISFRVHIPPFSVGRGGRHIRKTLQFNKTKIKIQ
jgi:hypothetical protein